MNLSEHFLIIVILVKYVLSDMEGYVMKGQKAKIKMFPYQVLLDIFIDLEYICGGAIVNQVTILTAAHCMCSSTFKIKEILVFYGAEKIKDMSGVLVKTFKIHEKYNDLTLFADLGIARCTEPIPLGRVAKRVAIMLNPPSTRTGYVAGWGVMNKHGDTSSRLLFTQQNIQEPRICSKLEVPLGAFCAGLERSNYPACGDSGSPLVMDEYIEIGLVSYKIGGYSLVVYTNVSYYFEWIKKQAVVLYCK